MRTVTTVDGLVTFTSGASGDGVTDDTSAIQEDVNEAGKFGGVVSLPSGSFRITRPILVPSNVTIRGAGKHDTRLLQRGVVNGNVSTYYAVFQLTGVSNVEISDLAIIGENAGVVTMPSGDQAEGIQCEYDTTDVTITRCFFQYLWGHGAQSFGASQRIAYIDNIAKDCGKNGLNASGVECRIIGNECTGNAYNGIEGAYTRSTITGNQCHRNLVAGIAVVGKPDSETGTGNTVVGNTCYQNVTGISVAEGVRYTTVTGNTAAKNQRIGIQFTGSGNADNECFGNTLYNNGSTAEATRLGIGVGGTRNRVAYNRLRHDAAIAGYQHQFAIQDFGTDSIIENNHSSGAASWDYDLGGTGYTVDLDTTGVKVRFRAGATVVRGRLYGTGSPEGVWTASPGVTFQRAGGGLLSSLYVKEQGTGTVGWSAK